MSDPQRIGKTAVAFHEAYERLAPQFGWETQVRSRVEWKDLPPNQKALMRAVVAEIWPDLDAAESKLAAAQERIRELEAEHGA